MKIAKVEVFMYELSYLHGAYVMSHGRSQSAEPSLVVKVTTDEGLVGWGETCPHGGTYLPAFFEGEREALTVLAPAIVGLDPRETAVVNAVMRSTLQGAFAAKSALDTACWDLFGKAAGLPLTTLLGGRSHHDFKVFVPVALDSPERMRAYVAGERQLGTRAFQLKVGNDPREDAARVRAVLEVLDAESTVIVDANGGWNIQDAIIATRELEGLPIYLEQPCESMSACAEVRRRTNLPMILDECINNLDDLLRARMDVGVGGVNLKPGRLGGPTAVRALRDAAAELGMLVTIDETWGGAIVTAMLSHLAASTPSGHLLTVSYFSEWTTPDIANAPQKRPDGMGSSSTRDGLGVDVDESLLGMPLYQSS